jgi:hypothetical protein
MESDKQNTHTYDGKLIDKAILIKELPFDMTLDNVITEIKESAINNKYSRVDELVGILDLFKASPNSNYDTTNKISVEEILPRLWKIAKSWDLSELVLLYEQIADVVNGSCPEGRCIRLMQLFFI